MDIVRTDHPILPSRAEITDQITTFWNKTTEGFLAAWALIFIMGILKAMPKHPLRRKKN